LRISTHGMPQPKAATTWAAQRLPGQEAVGEFTQTGGGSQVVELALAPQVAMGPLDVHRAAALTRPLKRGLQRSSHPASQALPREVTPVISSHRRTADAAPPLAITRGSSTDPATVDPGPSPTGPVGWSLLRPAAHGSPGLSQRQPTVGQQGEATTATGCPGGRAAPGHATPPRLQCPAGEAGGALPAAPRLTRGSRRWVSEPSRPESSGRCRPGGNDHPTAANPSTSDQGGHRGSSATTPRSARLGSAPGSEVSQTGPTRAPNGRPTRRLSRQSPRHA
jgi:hypothetical protein